MKNEGMLDRGVRVAIGVGLVGSAAAGLIGAWGFVGLIPLATGLAGVCPAYMLFGFSSCPAPKSKE